MKVVRVQDSLWGWLGAVDNRIQDLSPLASLAGITSLDLVSNQIADLSPLAGLGQLRWLTIYNNQIADIQPLAGLTELETVYLWANAVDDLSSLLDNPGLGAGDAIYLVDLPLMPEAINVQIPALRARGVNVYYDNIAYDFSGQYWYERLETNTATGEPRSAWGEGGLWLGHAAFDIRTGDTGREWMSMSIQGAAWYSDGWLDIEFGDQGQTTTHKYAVTDNVIHVLDRTSGDGNGTLGQTVLLRQAEGQTEEQVVGEYVWFRHSLRSGGSLAATGTVVLNADHTVSLTGTRTDGSPEMGPDGWSFDPIEGCVCFPRGVGAVDARSGEGGLMVTSQIHSYVDDQSLTLMVKKGSGRTLADATGSYLWQESLTDVNGAPMTRWGELEVNADGSFHLNLTDNSGSTTSNSGSLILQDDGHLNFSFDTLGLNYEGVLSANGQYIAMARMGQGTNGEVGWSLAVRKEPGAVGAAADTTRAATEDPYSSQLEPLGIGQGALVMPYRADPSAARPELQSPMRSESPPTSAEHRLVGKSDLTRYIATPLGPVSNVQYATSSSPKPAVLPLQPEPPLHTDLTVGLNSPQVFNPRREPASSASVDLQKRTDRGEVPTLEVLLLDEYYRTHAEMDEPLVVLPAASTEQRLLIRASEWQPPVRPPEPVLGSVHGEVDRRALVDAALAEPKVAGPRLVEQTRIQQSLEPDQDTFSGDLASFAKPWRHAVDMLLSQRFQHTRHRVQ